MLNVLTTKQSNSNSDRSTTYYDKEWAMVRNYENEPTSYCASPVLLMPSAIEKYLLDKASA